MKINLMNLMLIYQSAKGKSCPRKREGPKALALGSHAGAEGPRGVTDCVGPLILNWSCLCELAND